MNIIETKGITPVFEKSGLMVESGMNLIEYFAAHAPAAPDWFEPEMPDEPQTPEHYENLLTEEEVNFVHRSWNFEEDGWYDTAHDKRTKKVETVMVSWSKQYDQFRKDRRIWNETKQMQKIVQWPFFYATQVLKDYRERYVNY